MLTVVQDSDWEWSETLEASIEVVDEGCNEMDVVSPDLPSGELLGTHGDFGVIYALFGNQSQQIRQW